MPAALTDVLVVNAALEQIAAQTQITALSDGSPAAKAATVVYGPTVQLLLRDLDPDFARYTATLSEAVSPSQVPPWTKEYIYPTDCVRMRQVSPAIGSYDINDPKPIVWQVAYDVIAAVKTKVIVCNLPTPLGVYTSSNVTEVQWDASFTDAMVRRLANPLAMALSGRPDFADTILQQAAAMAQIAEGVDDAMITGP